MNRKRMPQIVDARRLLLVIEDIALFQQAPERLMDVTVV